MSELEQLVREAEELVKWHENQLNFIPERYPIYDHHKQAAALIRSLLSLLPKEGEVVVPVEPTEGMLEHQYISRAGIGRDLARKCYIEMLSARPR